MSEQEEIVRIESRTFAVSELPEDIREHYKETGQLPSSFATYEKSGRVKDASWLDPDEEAKKTYIEIVDDGHEQTILDRFKWLCNYLISHNVAKNQKELSLRFGYTSAGSLSHILSGRKPIPDKLLNKIGAMFPSINIEWIKTGEGQSIKEPSQSSTFENDGQQLDRLFTYFSVERITEKRLKEVGMSINVGMIKKYGFTKDQIDTIHEEFPLLNIRWLLTGQGEMIIATPQSLLNRILRLQEFNEKLAKRLIALAQEVGALRQQIRKD